MLVRIKRGLACAALLLLVPSARAAESDALAILANIKALHLPWGTILDPVFADLNSNQIVGYTRCGDSAIWTGHYLAAEAFRYQVTQAPDALANVQQAIAGIKGLVDVTGTNLLARCIVFADWPFSAGIQSEETVNGIHMNPPWFWVGNTSRDEYCGVIFGLGVAYDMVDDAAVKSSISDLVTRLVRFLTGHNWSVEMPDGSTSTTFLVRPDEMLAFLQVGRHVNSGEFSFDYDLQRVLLADTGVLFAPLGVDVLDNSSYFKFNLDYISLYNLDRLESSSTQAIYEKAYSIVRNHTAGHQNAFFDIIDRALEGPDAARDQEFQTLLDQWLLRPSRDLFVDVSGVVPVCGTEACDPVPVPLRPPTDFLWQRDPFQLSGGAAGQTERAGIDYILPYWMGRYYGVIGPFTVESAVKGMPDVAPDGMAALVGSNLAAQTQRVDAQQPLPTSLGGVTLTVKDSSGIERPALLAAVSPDRIDFVVPDGTAPGTATFSIQGAAHTLSAAGNVQLVAPALLRAAVDSTDPQSIRLRLFGTGIRNRSALDGVSVTVNGVSLQVVYAGPQSSSEWMDRVGVLLPSSLIGSGASNVVLTVDGQTANTLTVNL